MPAFIRSRGMMPTPWPMPMMHVIPVEHGVLGQQYWRESGGAQLTRCPPMSQ